MPAPWAQDEGLSLTAERVSERNRRKSLQVGAHLQPQTTPRAVARAQFGRGANGEFVALVGGTSGRDEPESARRHSAGLPKKAPSCVKAEQWGSAVEGLSHGEQQARRPYADSHCNAAHVKGKTERELIKADPNALVDALHGVSRPRVRGTSKDVRDIVNPLQLNPWKKSEAQRVFLNGATQAEYALFKRISEKVYSSMTREHDCATLMRELDPRGSGLLDRKSFLKVLHSIQVFLNAEEFDEFVKRLSITCAQLNPRAAVDDPEHRLVSIDFFLLVFDSDQRAMPGYPGEKWREPPAVRKPTRAADANAKDSSGEVGEHNHIEDTADRTRDPPVARSEGAGSENLFRCDPSVEFSRHKYVRNLVQKAGGTQEQYSLVRKVMQHFEETHLDVEKFMRGGDIRGSGRLRRREFASALRRAGVMLSNAEFDTLCSIFDRDNSGDIDYIEVCRIFDVRAWNSDSNALPWAGRTARIEHADACYAIEQDQRLILQGFPSSVWGLFRRVKQRLHELHLHAEDILIQMDTIDRDNIISKKEWRQGLRRLGVQVSDAECEILFRVFDRDKSGSMDVEEVCYMFQVDYRSKDGGDGAKRLLDARLRLISRYVFTSFLRRCAVTCK